MVISSRLNTTIEHFNYKDARDLDLKKREARREQEIVDRKTRKEEEKQIDINRLEELAKTSTSDRIQVNSSNIRDNYLKEKKIAIADGKNNLKVDDSLFAR